LFYHTGSQDTVPKLFTMTFGQNFGDPGLSFNTYENDFTSADFAIDMQDTVNGELLTYTQGAGGARTVLEFPGLDTLIGKGYSITALRSLHTFYRVQHHRIPFLTRSSFYKIKIPLKR